MRRRVFTLCSALSLLLLLVTVILWVRGHRAMEMLITQRGDATKPQSSVRQTVLSSTIGQLNFIRSGMDGGNGTGGRYGLAVEHGWMFLRNDYPSSHAFNRYSFSHFGFAWGLDEHAAPQQAPAFHEFQWFVSVPEWFLSIVFAIAPVFWLVSYRRDRQQRYRMAHKLCHQCGYDLRATPDRCPECGAPGAIGSLQKSQSADL